MKKLTLIPSRKKCENCPELIHFNVTLCGKCLIEKLRESCPTDKHGKLVLFPSREPKTNRAA